MPPSAGSQAVTVDRGGFGLKQKFALSATAVVALISGFIVVFFPWVLETQMKADLADKARGLAEMGARSSTAGLYFEDVQSVASALEGLAALEEVVFIEVFSSNGELFYAHQREGETIAGLEALKEVEPPETTTSFDRGTLWVTATPLMERGERVGHMALGLTTEELVDDARQSRRLAILVAGATLLVSFTTFWLLAARIVVPLRTAVGVADEIASGNLGAELQVTSSGETRRLLRSMQVMVESMRRVIGAIIHSSGDLSAVAGEVSGWSQRILEGAQAQSVGTGETSRSMDRIVASIRQVAASASELEEKVAEVAATLEETDSTIRSISESADSLASGVDKTRTTVEGMAGSIRQISEHAHSARAATEDAVEVADRGGRAVRETASGMASVAESMEAILGGIRKLDEMGHEITQIVDFINGVADSTNLLSLNASIEAAHAGEAGVGFAVVADEIRSLAQKSSTAAKKIGELIASVREEMENTRGVSEEGAARARDGLDLAETAGRSLADIAATIGTVHEAMGQVADLTKEQVAASEEMVETFAKMSEVTRHIDRATSEQASASERTMQVVHAMFLMTEQVSQAATEQRGGSEEVSQAVANISTISNQHLETAHEIAQRTEALSTQAEELLRLSSSFKLNGADGP